MNVIVEKIYFWVIVGKDISQNTETSTTPLWAVLLLGTRAISTTISFKTQKKKNRRGRGRFFIQTH